MTEKSKPSTAQWPRGTPAIDEVRGLKADLAGSIVETPVIGCPALGDRLDNRTYAKLEFLQRTGTFKARGALAVLSGLTEKQREAGVTAVSAGNHAIATAYAAHAFGVDAKVVMLANASPDRMEKCREYGATIELAEDVHSAFDIAEKIRREEGRFLVHPFEGPHTFRGTATIGLEICDQVPEFDSVIVPVGGGGLCAGIASAVKQLRPDVEVFGVEPEGADSMRRSFESGRPETLTRVTTIADSLGAPFALPLSFAICRAFVDELVTVSDDELRAAMATLFRALRIAVEPACAASTAALLGPLATRLRSRRTVLIMCGSNIDARTFVRHAFPELL